MAHYIPFGTNNHLARDEWIQKVLAQLPPQTSILDAGAGEQQYKRYCSHLAYTSQDFSLYSGKGDCRGLQMETWESKHVDIISDITAIPRPDYSFDTVMCTEVLEHVADPLAALRELTRLLKNGGSLILTAPFCALTHFSPHFYCNGFSVNYYTHWFNILGYDIVELHYNGNYFKYLAQELQRLPSVAEKYCRRKTGFLQRLSTRYMLNFLESMSATDTGSHELLSYGLQVLAKKR
jgi:ubiquinone/menaquinone biosynthesis C-methylase UbiE